MALYRVINNLPGWGSGVTEHTVIDEEELGRLVREWKLDNETLDECRIRLLADLSEFAGKDHHDYPKANLGASDIACLIAMAPGGPIEIKYGGDGSYSAYVVDAECAIPEHYKLVVDAVAWLKIYDDDGLVFRVYGDTIKVFQSGGYGTIIQVINRRAV